MTTTPHPYPPPSQFSIRLPRLRWIGLAAVILLGAAVGLSIGVPMYRRVAVIREIERLGGEVEIEPFGPLPLARWIARHRLIGLGKVSGVWLTGEQFDDEAPGLLRIFGGLDELVIDAPNMTDVGLLRISRMQAPRHLSIGGPNIGNAAIAHLASLTGLKSLWVASDNLTDEGMPALCRLTALEHLWVESLEVTGAGLQALAPLTNLTELQLVGTRVTPREVDRFRSAHPKMQVERSGSRTGCRWGAPVRFVFNGEIIFDDAAP
jgi:hypothetical protein